MAKVTILGSADAFHSCGRRHSAYLLEDGGFTVAVDFGPTALLSLRLLQFDPARLDAICITHLHGDHMGGLPFVVIDGMYYSPRAKTLQIAGPVKMKERFDLCMRASYEDILQVQRGFDINITELPPGASHSIGPFQLQTFAADHMDAPHSPLMFRFLLPSGKVISFSGDTRFTNNLMNCADGADLLVAECTGLAPPMGRHSTWTDWKANVHEVRAKKIVLSHLGAPVRERGAELLRELLESTGERRVSFAEDGETFTI
ncbi:MAG: MBL fold metallo-hydrolase [Planctomycetota bacterium]